MIRRILVLIIIFFLLTMPVEALDKSVVDISELTMIEELEYLDKGVLTSYELVSLYLDRINTYNSSFNALISINPNVLEEARKMDELRLKGELKGRLHGIPIIVKDNIDVVGMPTTGGAKALIDNYPLEDAPVVKKLKDEGAIIIAKANMSEFAFSAKDSNSSFGYVSNAYKLGYTSYGSSGGSAVAVALNFGSAALGTDTNSSVRLPANAAGLVGLRPSYGRLSNKGVIAYDINRDTVGIITKSVIDNELIMEILTDEKYDLSNNEKIVVGIPKSFYEGSNKSSIPANKVTFGPIKQMLDEEIERLENEGIEVVFIDDFYGNKEAYYNSTSISGFTMCKAFNEYILGTEGKIRNFKDLTKSSGKITGLSGYYKSCNYNKKDVERVYQYQGYLREHVDRVFEEYNLDYIIYPSTKNEIYKKSENDKLLNVSTTVSSTIGYPAIVVPLGYYEGMPYGLEIMALKNEEEKLYKMAMLIEKHNNLINAYETDTDKLYIVPDEVSKLVKLYLDNYDNESKEEWRNKVYEFFRKYNESDDYVEEARLLIEEFYKVEEVAYDEEEKIIYGLSYLAVILCPYSIKYIKRRKRVNNILYFNEL